jgi:hypothetical protein
MLSAIINALHEIYGSLKTWENWLDLYITVWYGPVGESIENSLRDNPEIHPTCFNDLVHKTTIYFQARHKVRFPFLEGQKRVCGTICATMNYKPRTEVKYHEASCEKWTIDKEEGYGLDIDLEKETPPNRKITSCGKIANMMIMVFRGTKNGNQDILSPTIIDLVRMLSKRLTITGSKGEKRDWNQMLIELCENPNLSDLVVPPFFDITQQDQPEVGNNEFNTWATGVRKSVLQALYKVGNDSTVFQDDLNQCLSQLKENTKSYVPVIKNEKDYADFCSLTALNKSAIAAEKAKHEESTEEEALVKIERKLKKGLNADGGIYLPKIPSPYMPNMIASMFSYLASGTAGSITAISKLAKLNGARVDNPIYNSRIRFIPNEEGYKTVVSKNGVCRYCDVALSLGEANPTWTTTQNKC